MIKHILALLFIIFQVYLAHSQIIYTSPVDKSELNRPETKIIIKFDRKISSLNIGDLFSIQGTNSRNNYNYSYKLINNGKTVLLFPSEPFKLNDHITIELLTPISFTDKTHLNNWQLKFQISKVIPVSDSTFQSTEHKLISTPDNFPSISVTINNNPAPGKIFFYNISELATNNDRYLSIIDNNGIPEYWMQENNAGLNFTLQPSGYLSFWNDQDFVLMDSTYKVFDTIACGNGYTADWHEFIHMANHHSLLFSWDIQNVDMSQIIEGGKTNALVQGLVIQELDEEKNVVFQWRSWDHFKITDAVGVDFTAYTIHYVHGNAMEVDKDGNILLSARLMNEITKINRTTGEIIWRLGGKNNQFEFFNDSDMFCRQHDIRRIGNGNITLYDNGECHDPQISTAKEYKIDTINKTAELIWEYQHPLSIYCPIMGNVQRLPNGNTFINWGMVSNNTDYPNITEVKPDKTIVFEMFLNEQFHLLYRSHRFVWDNDFIFTSLKKVNSYNSSVRIYPSPANNILNIKYTNDFAQGFEIKIFNVNGSLVSNSHSKTKLSPNTTQINIAGLPEGIYFLLIHNKESKAFKKFIISR